jgi:hypothetical protein
MSFSKYHFLAKMSEIKSDIEKLEAAIIDVVYGSNMIEGVGLNRNITASLCGDAFRGVEVISAENFDENDPDSTEYDAVKAREDIIRGRREIIQHAKVLEYIFSKIVYDN